MSAPYTMQALQELADDGVHLLEIDDAGLVATVQELDALRARVAELERERDEARERVLVMSDAWKAAMDNVARLRFALEWCEANWTTPAVDRGAGLPMVRAALAAVVAKAVGT